MNSEPKKKSLLVFENFHKNIAEQEESEQSSSGDSNDEEDEDYMKQEINNKAKTEDELYAFLNQIGLACLFD